jgi:hypothetical protein
MLCSELADRIQSLTTAPHDTAPPGGGGIPAPSLTECQVAALGKLVDIRLKVARAIERQVNDAGDELQPVARDLNAAAIAFGRVAGAVRQTIMLQFRLQDERNAAAA